MSSDFSKSEKESLTSTIHDLKTAKIPNTAPVYRSIILHELGWYGNKKLIIVKYKRNLKPRMVMSTKYGWTGEGTDE